MPVQPHQELLTRHAFLVDIAGLGPVGYFRSCSGLEIEVEVVAYAEGGNNDQVHQLPGRISYPPLVLENGLTKTTTMAEWFNKSKSKPDLKEVTITLLLEGSTEERKWTFADAFPVRWVGPQLTTGAADVASETLTIVHGGLKEA